LKKKSTTIFTADTTTVWGHIAGKRDVPFTVAIGPARIHHTDARII